MANKIDTFVRNPHMTNTADRRGTRKLSYLLLAFPLVNACADTHEIATSPTQSQLEAMNESFRALPTTSTCVRQGVNAGAHCIESMSLPSLQSAGVEVGQSRHQNRVVRWDELDKIVVVARPFSEEAWCSEPLGPSWERQWATWRGTGPLGPPLHLDSAQPWHTRKLAPGAPTFYRWQMALNKALIDILACPKCKGALDLKADESEFQCKSCKLVYAVIEGIPNFIVEEAKPLQAA